MRAQRIAGGGSGRGVTAAEDHRLDEVARQIVEAHPWMPRDRVESTLRTRYAATAGAKVQDYRLVLAERDTLSLLGHDSHRDGPGRRADVS